MIHQRSGRFPTQQDREYPARTIPGYSTMRGMVSSLLVLSPARVAIGLFMLVILVFTALLSLPVAAANHRPTALNDAGFTAVSAITVTGLSSVNTAEHWSLTGQIIILIAIQVGGIGVMTMVGMLAMAVSERIGLSSRLLSMQATGSSSIGTTRRLILTVLVTTFAIETVLAAVLIPRFIDYTDDGLTGIWYGIFYAISAFCNAGFSLHPMGLTAYAHDPWIILTVCLGVIIGSLGAPTLLVLQQVMRRRARLNLHAKLTLWATGILLIVGFIGFGLLEWNNPDTLGEFNTMEKIQTLVVSTVMPRSGGYAVYPVEELTPASMFLMYALIFIGGGSGSMAGGIKVTTLAVLCLAIVAEARGRQHVTVFHRTIPADTIRVAIALLVGSGVAVLTAMIVLSVLTGASVEQVGFEVLSAFGTCGLSTGLSEQAPAWGQLVLCVMMFLGRVGTITFAAGLATRHAPTLYNYPEERPVIG
ncbi:TrkH family potassium uptake protein [Auritidibacter ignavus]|uniref:TrkH family potassium uptake protein n=1 Tax=Auritidibacter ignavus TaxID=678932 RepID=UPI000F043DBE|nr:potassium transporter TrkG [Auritidibacter ignavus]NIH71329.1 Trk-type K+ transport system membrane component [Auritidibacter ignavus]RMX23497.1 TrkH family potassium uptake protein [Auritidibacter ignavus]